MFWLGLLCLCAAGAIGARWWMRRYDRLGRRRDFPSISMGLLVALAVAAFAPWFFRIRLEHRLSDAASRIVGSQSIVHCQTLGESFVDVGAEFGYVEFGRTGIPENRALIKHDQCSDLSAYLRSDKNSPDRDQIIAVHTLTHEAVHMSGEINEAKTECLAMQFDARMAEILGAPASGARNLASTYWRTVYPDMPDEYRSKDCAPGGSWDAELPEAPWAAVTASP